MSIKHELLQTEIPPERKRAIGLQLQSMSTLYQVMSEFTKPEQVLPYIKHELEGRNRISMVSRLYGKYRSLLPARDHVEMQVWANGKRQ